MNKLLLIEAYFSFPLLLIVKTNPMVGKTHLTLEINPYFHHNLMLPWRHQFVLFIVVVDCFFFFRSRCYGCINLKRTWFALLSPYLTHFYVSYLQGKKGIVSSRIIYWMFLNSESIKWQHKFNIILMWHLFHQLNELQLAGVQSPVKGPEARVMQYLRK